MKTADKELVLAALNGDKTAFEVLIRKYQNTVYGLIYSLVGNFSDAQDLTQEAFIRAYIDLHQLKDHSRFASWLCQVAKNICRMWNRHQKLDIVSLEQSIENRENGIMDIKDNCQNPAEIAEQQENQQRVLKAVNSLQETDRTIVTLFYMDGLTYQEVSNFLDMSVPAVESRLHRARKRLKGELKDMVQRAFANNKLREDLAERVIRSISTFNEINGLALSRDGNSLWCATRGGVVKLNIHTSQFIEEYTTANGLPDNVIMAIAVGDKDRLWCATMDGICMFDGEKWHICPELPPEVGGFTGDHNDIAIDKNGTVWVATHGIVWQGKTKAAVCKLEGDHWKSYPIDESLEGIGPVIYADREGRIWYGSEHGISMLQDEKWITHILENDGETNYVSSILQDSKGNMWFGTKKGVWKFDGSDWTNYSSESGLGSGGNKTLVEDKDGTILVSQGLTIYSFDGNRWTPYVENKISASTIASVAPDRISSMVIDKYGNKWIGTSRQGLYKFDGTKWSSYLNIETLPASFVFNILVDKQDNLWITTTEGLARYDGKQWEHIQDPVTNNAYLFFMDADNSIWLGKFAGGISKQDDNGWKIYYEEAKGGRFERQAYDIASIAQDSKGNLWFLTIQKGLRKFDGKEWTQFTSENGFPQNATYSMFIDKDDIIWIATSKGIYKYDGKSFVAVNDEGSPINKHVNRVSAGNRDDIWFGTWQNGVYRYDGKLWSNYTIEDGLAGDHITNITLGRNGIMWIGTTNGLSCFDGKKWTSYGTKNGLASRHITALAIDSKNILWIGTMGGLSSMNL